MQFYTIRVTCYDKNENVTEFRRFSLPKDFTIAQLQEAFGSTSAALLYKFEGDNIALRTEADIAELIRVVQPENNVFQLFTFYKPSAVSSFASSVATETKKIAEEAIVMGVRGSSYVQNKWKQAHSPPASPEAPKNVWVKTPPAPEGQQETPAPSENAEEEDRSGNIGTKIVEGAKSVAEEALVLGVRGYSYIDNEWQTRSHNGEASDEEPATPAGEQMKGSWVNVAEIPKADDTDADEPKAESAPEPAAAPAPAPIDYDFQKNLDELAEMGFMDVEHNKMVLLRNKNNLEAAIGELLAH